MSHPLVATCPAASLIAGAYERDTTVICSVLANDRDREEQGFQKGGLRSVTFTLAKDPSTVRQACCGAYQECLIWRAERDRISAGNDALEAA